MKFFANNIEIPPSHLLPYQQHVNLVSLTIDNQKMKNVEKHYLTMPSLMVTPAALSEPSLRVPVTWYVMEQPQTPSFARSKRPRHSHGNRFEAMILSSWSKRPYGSTPRTALVLSSNKLEQSQLGEYSSYLFEKIFFPVLRLRETPVGIRQKVMMTMASLMADNDPPRHHNNIIGTATPSLPLRESTASKNGTRGIDSLKNNNLTVLREIPTGSSPRDPSAAVVDRHDDRQPHQPHPVFSPTQLAHNSVLLPPQTTYDNYVNCTLEEINQMMRSWQPALACLRPTVVDRHADEVARLHQTHPDLSLPTTKPLGFSPLIPSKPAADDYVDSTLDKINQTISSWQSAIARERRTTTPPTAKLLPPKPEPSQHQLTPTSAIPDVTQPDFPVMASSPRCDADSHPQPQPLLSLQDTFVLQLKVLEKPNQVRNAIHQVLDRHIPALACPSTNMTPSCITPTCTQPATSSKPSCPSVLLEPTPKLVPSKPRSALVWKKTTIYVHPIPAKPPYCNPCRHLAPIQTARMRPP